MRKEVVMSFDVVCSGCGAPSSPSVGICPFCKTVMAANDGKEKHSIDSFIKLYNDGKLERALGLGTEMYKAKPELKSDLAFVLTFAKVLIESEGPSSKIRSVLAEAHLVTPESVDVIDYLEIVEAKNNLKKGLNDTGEIALKNLLRRSPKNVHAHFVLGTHLFWMDNESATAIPHLETCVRLHPNFLRAWGCLAAIYRKMGNNQLAQMAFQKCATIETNQSMKEFFEKQARAS
jgi:predicted Zn-dependent protease